jgi:hypothetical protein
MTTTQEYKDQLEQAIDHHGLPALLATLAEIANEKADHIESNWQDKPLARCWRTASAKIEGTSEAVARMIPDCYFNGSEVSR